MSWRPTAAPWVGLVSIDLRNGARSGAYAEAVTQAWCPTTPGVLRLPSGRTIRGRGLRMPALDCVSPDFGIYLLSRPPAPSGWEERWVRWPDLRLPADKLDACDAICEAWRRAGRERVEIACVGGRGRTGTALACVALLDGMPADEAVAFVREHYDPRAIETPFQRRYVARFSTL